MGTSHCEADSPGRPDFVTAEQKPFLQVVRGDASPEEIAALVAVLTARALAAADDLQ
ncbi:acyl-CoA carboxylase subunit epsilon, partial [Actinomadura sp. BRA 177]|nr:acyl-CoA carboxylase subunit epsilon [Actinomadura sp. BRA 177]